MPTRWPVESGQPGSLVITATAAGGAGKPVDAEQAVMRRRAGPDHRARPRRAAHGGHDVPVSMTTVATSGGLDIIDRQSENCPPVAVDSEHMRYLSIPRPRQAKGILHPSAGYLVEERASPTGPFRPEARRRLLVRRDIGWVTGHSYIVEAAGNGAVRRDLRGARPIPRLGALVGDHRGVQVLDPVLRPDGDPRLHEQGERHPSPARPQHAAHARLGRRVDQPRGVAWYHEYVGGGKPRSSTPGGRPRPA